MKRIFYILATIILLGIEVLIALFVHDDFVRPYFICYGIGCVVLGIYEFVLYKRTGLDNVKR